MPMTIWKTELKLQPIQQVELPQQAEILFVREQHGVPCMWYRCDPALPKELRTIEIVGTGHTAPDAADTVRYLGSVMMADGNFVWHIFMHLWGRQH